jgi:GMP synthase (glutamine-hydrolysing)
MIGFCLGSQLIAYALGASVYPNSRNGKVAKEIGYYDITLTPQGQNAPIFTGFSPKFAALEWHGDTFDIPKDASYLASSQQCINQAFSYENAFGLLFHCEFTPDMIKKQIEVDKIWIHEGFALDETFLLKQANEYAAQMDAQNNSLFTNFLSVIKNK